MVCFVLLGRLRTPVCQAFLYGIRHVFIVMQWTVTHSSVNHNLSTLYRLWKYLPYGSPQPLYCVSFWHTYLVVFNIFLTIWSWRILGFFFFYFFFQIVFQVLSHFCDFCKNVAMQKICVFNHVNLKANHNSLTC